MNQENLERAWYAKQDANRDGGNAKSYPRLSVTFYASGHVDVASWIMGSGWSIPSPATEETLREILALLRPRA